MLLPCAFPPTHCASPLLAMSSSSAAFLPLAKKGAAPPPPPPAAAGSRSRVIYLGHIPKGFFEEQIRGYFEQFGGVTRLRLARSKKTARSRGWAMVEFEGA